MDPRQVAQNAVMQKEMFARAVILLTRAIETQTDDILLRVDGKIALRKAAFDEASKKHIVSLRAVKASNASDPTAPDEELIVVEVKERQEAPTLVVAKSMSNGGIALP
mgnify:CR=1 FL=1